MLLAMTAPRIVALKTTTLTTNIPISPPIHHTGLATSCRDQRGTTGNIPSHRGMVGGFRLHFERCERKTRAIGGTNRKKTFKSQCCRSNLGMTIDSREPVMIPDLMFLQMLCLNHNFVCNEGYHFLVDVSARDNAISA